MNSLDKVTTVLAGRSELLPIARDFWMWLTNVFHIWKCLTLSLTINISLIYLSQYLLLWIWPICTTTNPLTGLSMWCTGCHGAHSFSMNCEFHFNRLRSSRIGQSCTNDFTQCVKQVLMVGGVTENKLLFLSALTKGSPFISCFFTVYLGLKSLMCNFAFWNDLVSSNGSFFSWWEIFSLLHNAKITSPSEWHCFFHSVLDPLNCLHKWKALHLTNEGRSPTTALQWQSHLQYSVPRSPQALRIQFSGWVQRK